MSFSSYRQRTYLRMLRALRAGRKRSEIKGDRDILQYAVETYDRERAPGGPDPHLFPEMEPHDP